MIELLEFIERLECVASTKQVGDVVNVTLTSGKVLAISCESNEAFYVVDTVTAENYAHIDISQLNHLLRRLTNPNEVTEHFNNLDSLVVQLQEDGIFWIDDVKDVQSVGVDKDNFKLFKATIATGQGFIYTVDVHGSQLSDCQNGESLESFINDYIQVRL